MEELEIESRLAATADDVWGYVITPEGINNELKPWLRMTVPRALRGATVTDVPVGVTLGRSWILFGGLFPFDFDDLCLAELERHRFLERSRTMTASVWEHERTITALGDGGSMVRDRVRFEPRRLIATGPGRRVMRAVVGAIFKHRHRRLEGRFGVPPVT